MLQPGYKRPGSRNSQHSHQRQFKSKADPYTLLSGGPNGNRPPSGPQLMSAKETSYLESVRRVEVPHLVISSDLLTRKSVELEKSYDK